MKDSTLALDRNELELPGHAPLVRITAGAGSANQKTWNVRRPVTLIGSCRPAHIVLHDHDITKAHCVIVNTGRDVLLMDLSTASGTFCNNERVELAALKDGDVLTVGTTKIQIAIRLPEGEAAKEDSGCGVEYVEPTRLAKPLVVRLDHTDTCWRVEHAVVMIGRHADATIRIDHPDVSTRHALLFVFDDGHAVFDLGSRTGVFINGGACVVAGLRAGDRVGVGPRVLAIGAVDSPSVALVEDPPVPAEVAVEPLAAHLTPPLPLIPPAPPALTLSTGEPRNSDSPLTQLESELNVLQRNITESWERMNRWQLQLREDADKLHKQDVGLAAREAELDAKDAALRGQLHDLTRYHEQITVRERELAAQLARIQGENDRVTSGQADLEKREGDIARRGDELQRREHVLAQRWARLLAANCPHCGKPVRSNSNEPVP